MGQQCCQGLNDDSHSIKVFNLKKKSMIKPINLIRISKLSKQRLHKSVHCNLSLEQKSVFKHKQDNRFFIGDFKENQNSADGVLYMPGVFLYKGAFVNGTLEGQGQIVFIQKDQQYKGNLLHGKADGRGLYKNNKKKITFQGQWYQSAPHKGTIIFQDNPNILKIQIKDFQSGHAHISYKDGRQYEGEIDKQKFIPSGQGKLVSEDGSSYFGQWKNGLMHGKGVYQWKDGSKYEGQYFENKKSGHGTFYYSSGKKYIGAWSNGKQEGDGKMFTKEDQLIKQGKWKDGKYLDQLKIQLNQNAQETIAIANN